MIFIVPCLVIQNSVADQAEKMGKQCKFYISVGRFAYIKRRKELNNCKRENIIYISKPISEMDNYDNMEKSKTILDVQFSSQILVLNIMIFIIRIMYL